VSGSLLERQRLAGFGRRRLAPQVCIVDVKPHIRTFLAEALEELGFIAHQCGRAADVAGALADVGPDLIVLGSLAPESDVTKVLHFLAGQRYAGRVMLFGGRASQVLLALHELGEQAGLAMLPPLRTPFRDSDLTENLADFLPVPAPPSIAIDVDEALRNNWLELWYQPKIDLRDMSLAGVEALIRMRHPAWGVVPPAAFIPGSGDPRLIAMSDFVVGRAFSDWSAFVGRRGPIGMTIHLPMSALEEPDFIERMCLRLPDHAALAPLTVEIASVEIGRDPTLTRRAAKQLADYGVGISIDDVMAEASWVDVGGFPIAELQVDRAFIQGCADDRHKRTACGMALSIAAKLGARTVAKGIEASADFKAVCALGFGYGQGFLFAKPMDAGKLARTMLRGKKGGAG
jgi:EAL domain-containing protein (putative c-di-GMP-specific phosphodiesterase class I)/CheY-like chemotaxis protein